MIIITNEMLDKAFGDMRVNGEGELYSWSVEALSKRDIYGKDVKYVIIYDGCSDPQKYVDNWMNSTLANNYAEEYFKGEDNMNKYETLLKKYGKLCREFEAYKENAEDVAIELIEVNSMYDELKKENDTLQKERENLAQQVVYLKDKIKQRDKQITELIRKNNVLKEERDCLLRKIKEETNVNEKQVADLIKERDEYAKRLEHINAMSNLEWKFEVVEETETSKSPYDELVAFCENRREGGKDCFGCPNDIACDGINPNFRPAKWTENQKEDYNELIAMVNNKEDK